MIEVYRFRGFYSISLYDHDYDFDNYDYDYDVDYNVDNDADYIPSFFSPPYLHIPNIPQTNHIILTTTGDHLTSRMVSNINYGIGMTVKIGRRPSSSMNERKNIEELDRIMDVGIDSIVK